MEGGPITVSNYDGREESEVRATLSRVLSFSRRGKYPRK